MDKILKFGGFLLFFFIFIIIIFYLIFYVFHLFYFLCLFFFFIYIFASSISSKLVSVKGIIEKKNYLINIDTQEDKNK